MQGVGESTAAAVGQAWGQGSGLGRWGQGLGRVGSLGSGVRSQGLGEVGCQ